MENIFIFCYFYNTLGVPSEGVIAVYNFILHLIAGTDKGVDGRLKLDYTLYTKFWSLQDFFRNPVQCFQKAPWKMFTTVYDFFFIYS